MTISSRVDRVLALALVSASLGACDDATTLAPVHQPLEVVAFAGGIPIGTFGQPNSEFGDRYNGAQRNILPADLLASLSAIQAQGGKVMLSIAGGPNQYKDADGHFSLSMWQTRVKRYEGIDFSAYIDDGTVIGHYLLDEPNDPANWNGVTVPGDTVEAMAEYSKQLWPDLPTIVRVDAAYLARAGIAYRYLDAAWAQYVARKGEVNDFFQKNLADAQGLGLELVVGLNLLNGGPNGVAMTAAQVREWGAALLSSSYPCAFLSWKYDATYLAPPEMGSAMDELRGLAQSRGTKSCASSGGAPPPPPPDPPSSAVTLSWAEPEDLTYGSALGSAQLNATASAGGEPVAGTFQYEPAAGTVLNVGEDQVLKVTFTPNDADAYAGGSATVQLDVLRASTSLTLDAASLTVTYNGQGRAAQFTTTPTSAADNVTLVYRLGGQVVTAPTNAGVYQVTATLPATSNYEGATATGNLTINPAAPGVAWSVPASTVVGPVSSALLSASASGVGGAAVPGTFTYSPAAGQFLDAAPSRTLSVTFQPSSANYTAATRTVSLAVLYPWSGFFEPTNNPQVLNRAKAGSAIPVRFGLGGDRPAPVLASGSPEVTTVSCPKWNTDIIEQTVSASSSSLRYESSTGQYVYTWKTESNWVGGCRRFRITLKDGTRREAYFRFVR